MNNTKSVDFFEENGVEFTRIDCQRSIVNPGHYTDVYRGSDGRIIYRERLKNAISSPSHVRNNLEGSLKSISLSLERIINGAIKGCSEKELNTFILQSQHHIDNTSKHFQKQDTENSKELFVTAIDDCVSAVVDEKCLSMPSSMVANAIRYIVKSEQINLERNLVVKHAFEKKLIQLNELAKDANINGKVS